MTASVLEAAPREAAAEVAPIDQLGIEREPPDVARAPEFDGHALVQSFLVPLPGGATGRAWIPTAEALTVPGFGRTWVAERLNGDPDALAGLTAPGGLRLG